MAKTKTTEATTGTAGITFIITDALVKKLNEWKQAHNTIFGYCDESEYEYVFTKTEEGYSIVVKNTYHDTEIDLTDETSW